MWRGVHPPAASVVHIDMAVAAVKRGAQHEQPEQLQKYLVLSVGSGHPALSAVAKVEMDRAAQNLKSLTDFSAYIYQRSMLQRAGRRFNWGPLPWLM